MGDGELSAQGGDPQKEVKLLRISVEEWASFLLGQAERVSQAPRLRVLLVRNLSAINAGRLAVMIILADRFFPLFPLSPDVLPCHLKHNLFWDQPLDDKNIFLPSVLRCGLYGEWLRLGADGALYGDGA